MSQTENNDTSPVTENTTNPDAEDIIKSTYWRVRYFSIGVWIAFLYIIFIGAVLFSLSVYQFKREIESIPAEVVGTLTKTVFVPHQCDITTIKGRDDIESSIVELPCVRQEGKSPEDSFMASDLLRKGNFDLSALDAEIELQKIEILRLETALSLPENAGDIEFIEGNLVSAKGRLDELQVNKKDASEANIIFQKLIQDNQFYDRFFSWLIPVKEFENIWTIPEAILSILLALSMGGLGSLITVTIVFIKIEENSEGAKDLRVSRFIFRPMLGTIVALTVYIAIRSGQVSVSDDSVAELSPFLLSFMGILSGMMSEYVYSRLIKHGEKMI